MILVIARDFADGTQLVDVEHPDGAREVILTLDGCQISRTFIVPMLIRIGAAVVRMDGIGGVETNEEYRHRGYSRRVLETAVQEMRAGDAALSTLYGISDFYPKFGYASVGPEYTMSLPLGDHSEMALPPGWSVRGFAAEDLPAVKRLYQSNTRRATAALMRHDEGDELAQNAALARSSPPAVRIGQRAWNRLAEQASEAGDDDCRVVCDDAGTIVAYAWLGRRNWWMGVRQRDAPESFPVAEVMASDPTAADAVLAACRRWAVETRPDVQQIAMAIPPEGPVFSAAAYDGGTVIGVHTRDGDFMGRVLDTGRLLSQMQPEFSARARAVRTEFRGEVTLRTDEGEATLFITSDGVSVEDDPGTGRLTVELPQATLARLCLGAFETGDVLARLPNPPGPETAAIVRMLFPRRVPHIYPMDRF